MSCTQNEFYLKQQPKNLLLSLRRRRLYSNVNIFFFVKCESFWRIYASFLTHARDHVLFFIFPIFFLRNDARAAKGWCRLCEREYSILLDMFCVCIFVCARMCQLYFKVYIRNDISGDLDEGQFSLLIWCFLYML